MTLKLILITVILLALAIGGIGIKMFIKKDGQFTKSCTNSIDENGKPGDCICDSQQLEKDCPNFSKHHGE